MWTKFRKSVIDRVLWRLNYVHSDSVTSWIIQGDTQTHGSKLSGLMVVPNINDDGSACTIDFQGVVVSD